MTDIFTPVDVPTNDIPENALETLVGEGKKFTDLEALAKSKLQSDRFISQLELDNKELREAAQKALTLEEVKTMILSQLKPEAQSSNQQQQPPATPPAAPVTDSDLEKLVATLLEKKESERLSKTNREKVEDTLRSKFGQDTQLVMNQKAKELGVSLDYLADVANVSPSAFYRLVGIEGTTQVPNAPAPRSTTSVPQDQNTRSAYWEQMKKNNPREYFSVENTNKRYKEAMAATK